MRKHLGVALVVFGLLLAYPTSAIAVQPSTEFSSCKSLWTRFPRGVVSSAYFASNAVAKGYLRPKVAPTTYFDNDIYFSKDYVVCGVKAPPPPATAPSGPANVYASPSTYSASITLFWSPSAKPSTGMVYDVYLDGAKVKEGITLTSATIDGLNPSQTYTVGVLARSAAGSSPITAASSPVTITNAEQLAYPGQVKVVYTGTGLVDVTLSAPTGTQQFSGVTNPSYTFWFAPKSFIYFSVRNQNDSGDVSCSVTANGRTVSTNTSSGAYVIATCKGTA